MENNQDKPHSEESNRQKMGDRQVSRRTLILIFLFFLSIPFFNFILSKIQDRVIFDGNVDDFGSFIENEYNGSLRSYLGGRVVISGTVSANYGRNYDNTFPGQEPAHQIITLKTASGRLISFKAYSERNLPRIYSVSVGMEVKIAGFIKDPLFVQECQILDNAYFSGNSVSEKRNGADY